MASEKSKTAIGTGGIPPADWLARQASEEILEPSLPIVDPHHHLWDRAGHRYLLDELLAVTGRYAPRRSAGLALRTAMSAR